MNTVLAAPNAQEAITWLLDHSTDPEINDPLPGEEEPMKITHLVEEKGYTRSQAVEALKGTDGDLVRSYDYLVSRYGNPREEAVGGASDDPRSAMKESSSKYRLVAFINHAGKSSSSGHYVAHVHRKGEWLKCNDRVVVAGHPDQKSSRGAAWR